MEDGWKVRMNKLAPFLHSKMFVAVVAIVLIWTVS